MLTCPVPSWGNLHVGKFRCSAQGYIAKNRWSPRRAVLLGLCFVSGSPRSYAATAARCGEVSMLTQVSKQGTINVIFTRHFPSFSGIKFKCQTIYLFEGCKWVDFSICTNVCKHQHNVRTYSSPQEETHTLRLSSPQCPAPFNRSNHESLFLWMSLLWTSTWTDSYNTCCTTISWWH